MSGEIGAVSTQRLFFALWPEPEVQQQLAHAASALLPRGVGRLTQADNLHCTLVFLGNVTPAQRLCVEDVASRIQVCRFQLQLDRFGYFRRPQVAWLGCTSMPAELPELVTVLSHGAADCGFPADPRPYQVHLTIARKVRRDPGRPPVIPILWEIGRFALVESVGVSGGVQYRPLRWYELLPT